MESPVKDLIEMKKELMSGSDLTTQEDLSSLDEIEALQQELLAKRELLHQSRMALLKQVVQDTLAHGVAMDGFRK